MGTGKRVRTVDLLAVAAMTHPASSGRIVRSGRGVQSRFASVLRLCESVRRRLEMTAVAAGAVERDPRHARNAITAAVTLLHAVVVVMVAVEAEAVAATLVVAQVAAAATAVVADLADGAATSKQVFLPSSMPGQEQVFLSRLFYVETCFFVLSEVYESDE